MSNKIVVILLHTQTPVARFLCNRSLSKRAILLCIQKSCWVEKTPITSQNYWWLISITIGRALSTDYFVCHCICSNIWCDARLHIFFYKRPLITFLRISTHICKEGCAKNDKNTNPSIIETDSWRDLSMLRFHLAIRGGNLQKKMF